MNWRRLRPSNRQQSASRETPLIRPIKNWLLALLLFITSLLIGLLLSFPTNSLGQLLLQELSNRGQVTVETRDFSLAPPLVLHGTETTVRTESAAWPPLTIESFDLSPLWLSLFSGNPGVRWDGQMLNGQLLADLYRDGSLSLKASNLSLDFPLLENSDNLRLTGQLVDAQVQSAMLLRKTTESSLKLLFENVELAGLNSGPRNLMLGTIVLEAVGSGNSFKVTTLKATGGDFSLDGKGTFLVGRNLPSSRLNLEAEIRPGQNADPNLVSLLDLVAPARADGSHQLKLSGTLSNPVLK